MLVLARRPQQSIHFPTLGISVQIVRVVGQSVRLGIEAPRSIPILRQELDAPATIDSKGSQLPAADEATQQGRHRLRGRLNSATIALYLAQRQLQNGMTGEADETLRSALGELEKLEGEWAAQRTSSPAPRRSVSRVRALLVEDNPFESSLLESYLRLSGIDVANASDGLEALDYLATHESPDAVLLDMRLPRCDGPTTVAAIRSNPSYSRLKVFAVSGSRPDEVAVPTGVDGWFSKPLDPAKLVEALVAVAG